MTEPNISPLARRLAEENNVDWRSLDGSGAEGKVVERDVLDFLARVMAGDEDLDPTPEPLPDGMDAWPDAPDEQEHGAARPEPGGTTGEGSADDEAGRPGADEAWTADVHAEAADAADGMTGAPDVDAWMPDDAPVDVAAGSRTGPVDEGDATAWDTQANDDVAAEPADDDEPIDEGIFLFDDTEVDAEVSVVDAMADEDAEIAAAFEGGDDTRDLVSTAEDAIDPVLSGEFEIPESALQDAPDLFADDDAAEDVEDDLDSALIVGDSAAGMTSGADEPEPDVATPDLGLGAGAARAGMDVDADAMDTLRFDEVADDAGAGARAALRLDDEEIDGEPPVAGAHVSSSDAYREAPGLHDALVMDDDDASPADVPDLRLDDGEPAPALETEDRALAAHADAPEDVEPELEETFDQDVGDDVGAAPVPSTFDAGALPLVTHGRLLRRHLDITALAEAQHAVARELGEAEPVEPTAFLVRAAAKALAAAPVGDGTAVGLAHIGATLEVRAIDRASSRPFRELLDDVRSERASDTGPAAPSIGLIVADLSALGVDEAVLDLDAPVLTLGRVLYDTHADRTRTTLSLSGDVAPDVGANLLGTIAEMLDAPVRLVM